jgi:adenylate cyclase
VSDAFFSRLNTWLLSQAISGSALPDLISGLGRELDAAGLRVDRISTGQFILHPAYGLIFGKWDAATDQVEVDLAPRSILNRTNAQLAPFSYTAQTKTPVFRARLGEDLEGMTFPLLHQLQEEGFSDYLLLFQSMGMRTEWMKERDFFPGINLAFATRQKGGFTDDEIANLKAILLPYSAAARMISSERLARTILDTYLGSYSGQRVLEGQVIRGDSRLIDCVLFYADMRDSTPLAEALSMEAFLTMVNDYLDCTAGAILDHGGEVLRYIGDALFAIFPFDRAHDPRSAALAARSATLDAIKRVNEKNRERKQAGVPAIHFGVGLHAGRVMYGNIGTESRLEFSVTGPAANEVARLEGHCKTLERSALASAAFQQLLDEELEYLGRHQAPGVKGGLTIYALS